MKTIIANWKANPTLIEEAKILYVAEIKSAQEYSGIKTVICPPFVFLGELAKISRDFIGAQDIFWEKSGPFTGEVSTQMLKEFGVSHVLIGHSDRRYILGESDEIINKKLKASLEVCIIPVLLIGERAGENREEIIASQLSKDLEGLSPEDISKVLFAYEPVWAISTQPGARPDTPENALEAIRFIGEYIFENWKLKIENCLYGGSVNEKNIADFLKHPEISGAVIGGASLRKEEFVNVLKLTSEIR